MFYVSDGIGSLLQVSKWSCMFLD